MRVLKIILFSLIIFPLGFVAWINLTTGYFRYGKDCRIGYFTDNDVSRLPTGLESCSDKAIGSLLLSLARLDFNRGPRSNGRFCLEVITPARSLKTGDCREFPTTCLPPDYKEDKSCGVSGEATLPPESSPTSVSPTNSSVPLVINETAETSSWPVYRNESCSYTIKYPSSWTGQVVAAGTGIKGLAPQANEVDFYQKEGRKKYPIGVLSIMCFGEAPSSSDYLKTELLVNGRPMTKWSMDVNDGRIFEIYLISRGNNFIELNFRYEAGDFSKETFDQILSTFRSSK